MNSANAAWFAQAKADGLIPADAAWPTPARPWPLLLLSSFGAWMVAVPLLVVIGLLFGEALFRSSMACVGLGVACLLIAVFVLRAETNSLFGEQIAVAFLIAGCGLIGVGFVMAGEKGSGLFRENGMQIFFVTLAGLCGAIAWALPRPALGWLRQLLGMASAVALYLSASSAFTGHTRLDEAAFAGRPALMPTVIALMWLAWVHVSSARGLRAMQPFALGWGVGALAILAFSAGQTFLLSGALGGGARGNALAIANDVFRALQPWKDGAVALGFSALSSAFALIAAARLALFYRARDVDAARATALSAGSVGVALVAAALAWMIPHLGIALLLSVVALSHGFVRVAMFGALVCVWVLGTFYYSLALPLATKALVLTVVGALLGALAFWAQRWHAARLRVDSAATSIANPWARAALALATPVLATAAGVYGIKDKEHLIAHGKPVYVALAPRDPRSMLQGDFMALRFALPREAWRNEKKFDSRPFAIGLLNEQGVVTFSRMAPNAQPRAANEIAVQLTAKSGDWTVVTDAWFFKEGDAKRWEAARFGEFRVMPDGRALLVGLADEQLRLIQP